MQPNSLRARVRNGRLVLDEPTDLPEGSEVELAVVDKDELGEDDRARLHAALDAADDELRAGKGIAGEQLIAELRVETDVVELRAVWHTARGSGPLLG